MAKENESSILPVNTSSLEVRLKQLEAERDEAIRRAESAEARAGALESGGSDRHYTGDKPVVPATRNKQTWPFRVHCNAPKNHPDIPDEDITAVDESEAIRQFCLMRKDEKQRQLDPTRYVFSVTCLKPIERAQQQANKINNRRAVAAGKLDVLSRQEEFRSPEANAKAQGKRLSTAS